MAIHFNYIKGLNGNVTKLSENTTTSGSDDLYTFIKWAGRDSNATPNKDAKYLPHIYVERTNALGSNDLGRIITSHAVNQNFYEEIKHNKSIQLYTDTTNNWSSIRFFCNSSISGVTGATGSLGKIFAKETNENITHWSKQVNDAGLCIDMGGLFVKNSFYVNQTIDNKARVVSYRPLRIDDKGSNIDYVEISEGNIMAGGHIDSLYFNATSDRRAKTNIQHWDTSALDIVTQLPIYEFHYKNNDTPSIGVIAQDAAEFDDCFTDFSLVDNPNATGENGDYMTIKESKLVYILWKAVQEQQEQIEQLKAELNKIKESR